ncbi:MAG: hypothetical protein IH624_02875 [Phycisphaerae bacterium]|nr:hypothetical protein [Phycisphaerae bacterium]
METLRQKSFSAVFMAGSMAFLCCLVAAGPVLANSAENFAKKARITADSEYSGDYAGRLVADGRIPARGGHDDVGQAWCVQGDTHRGGAHLSFEWEAPVTVSEVIYYGRCAWFDSECWKDFQIFADDGLQPVAAGQLQATHLPQRITLVQPASVRRLTLRFLSSYGGPNPGANEIQIFPRRISDAELKALLRQTQAGYPPMVEGVDCEKLRELIEYLRAEHGPAYCSYGEHLRLLEKLAEEDAPEALEALEREALLFDIDRVVVIRRHEIVASHVYTYHYEGFRAGGGLYVMSLNDPTAEPVELVASPTGQILDCDLSYDGQTVLFSWRRTENEGYHLWQVNVDGSGLRQLTDGEWHDYNGCWLPDGGIAFLSSRVAQFAYCWHAPVGIVHRMDADGGNVRLLSANYLNDFTPYPLDDGRIIYSRWEYVDKPAIPIQSLWTINPDGTGLQGYFGNGVLSPGTFMEARQIPGTTKILCTMTGHNGPTRGAIGVIDRRRGVNAQAAIWNVTPDVPVPAVDKGNGNTDGSKLYSCPLPLDGRRFVVSAKGPVLVRTIEGDCQSVALDAPDDGMQYFNMQPIRERLRPPVVDSGLGQTVKTRSDAVIYLQDVYKGLEPQVKRGEVKRIRVVREMEKTVRIDPSLRAFGFQFPVISCGATYAGKTVLGEVPVEADGSAYFRVPAGMPIYFMALDAQGRALQRMRSFTHLMPGEVQGCVGCHEPRGQAPKPVRPGASRGAPRELDLPEWGVRGFDYSRIVQPVLDQYCTACHNPSDRAGKVDLSASKTDYFNVSYDVLARERQGAKGSPYVNWIPTYNGQEQNILEVRPLAWGSPQSRLAEIVLSGHPDSEGRKRFEMDEASRRRILAWIDLNVPYYGSSETAYPELIGCRWVYPEKLDPVLADVGKRRCASCHTDGKVPRREWTRVTEPEHNDFLMAPLAKSAGGWGTCGGAVFASKEDADYQAILETFKAVTAMLRDRPRMDMPGAQPAASVCRDRK